MLLGQFPLAFLHTHKGTILGLIGTVFVIISVMFYGRISLNSVLLLLLLNFKVEDDVYIPHRKYHVKPHSSPWFSAEFMLLPYLIEITFFCLYQRNKSSISKVKFTHASNHCQTFLKLPNLIMPIEHKSLSLPRNMVRATFAE